VTLNIGLFTRYVKDIREKLTGTGDIRIHPSGLPKWRHTAEVRLSGAGSRTQEKINPASQKSNMQVIWCIFIDEFE
jgi:hypothetical protein